MWGTQMWGHADVGLRIGAGIHRRGAGSVCDNSDVSSWSRSGDRHVRATALTSVGWIVAAMCVMVLSVVPAAVASAAPATAQPQPAGSVEVGPYAVTDTVTTASCAGSLYGQYQIMSAKGYVTAPLRCTDNFPYGTATPVDVHFTYPTSGAGPFPLVVLVPGFTGNPGYFDATARIYASFGFVVAVAFDALNLTPESHLLGISAAYQQNNDPHSPLHHRIDLRRTIVGGHSAGAAAALQTAQLAGPLEQATRGQVRLAAAMSIQPAAATMLISGGAISIPTFLLAGELDNTATPASVRALYEQMSGPAWFAMLTGAHHLTSIDAPEYNGFLNGETAWLRFVAGDDSACRYFAGGQWSPRVFPNFSEFDRNRAAASSPCPPITSH